MSATALNRTARKIIGWPAFQVCFWSGDLVCLFACKVVRFPRWYPVYNQLMRWSLRIDRWADLGKWRDAS